MELLLLILWIIPHAVLILCVIGLLRHFRFRKVPFFLGYLVFEEILFASLLSIQLLVLHRHSSNAIYQWAAVVGIGISSCLSLGVFYEIVNALILPRSLLLTALRPIIRWATAGTILLAAGISAGFSTAGLKPITHMSEVMNFSTNLVNSILLLVLFLFTRTFHVSWKSLPAGIALGLGIDSSIEIGATSLIPALGAHSIVPGDIVRMTAYLVCTLVWLVYIFRREDSVQFTGQSVQKSEVEAWSEELGRIVGR